MNTFDITVFILTMIIAFSVFLYLVFLWILDIFILRTYQVTEAKVIDYKISQVPRRADKIEEYGYIYQLYISYDYQIDNRSYQSNKLNLFNNVNSRDRANIEKLIYTKNNEKYINIHYKSKKPSNAYAFPNRWRKQTVLLYMCLNLFAGLIILFFYIMLL